MTRQSLELRRNVRTEHVVLQEPVGSSARDGMSGRRVGECVSEPVTVYEARMAHAMATDASRAHSMRYTHSHDFIAVSMPISDGKLPLSELL